MSIINRVTYPHLEEMAGVASRSVGGDAATAYTAQREVVTNQDGTTENRSGTGDGNRTGTNSGNNDITNDIDNNSSITQQDLNAAANTANAAEIASANLKHSTFANNQSGSTSAGLIGAGTSAITGYMNNREKKKNGGEGDGFVDTYGAAIGAAGHAVAGAIDGAGSDEDAYNREKYAMGSEGSDTADSFGVWGQLIGGVSDTLTSALGSGDEYNNYGQESSTWYSDFAGIADPYSSGMDGYDQYEKGNINEWELAASWLGYSGFTNDAKQKEAQERESVGNKRKKDMEAQRERLKNIENSKQDYQDLMRNANMYGGAYIARKGGTIKYKDGVILKFEKGSVIARKHYKTKPIFKNTKKNTLIFKSGGNFKQTMKFNKPILKKSIIMDGALHSEFNNIGEGDKGLPIVMSDGGKIYEIETRELLLSKTDSNSLLLNEDKDDETLGKVFSDILLNNTDSKAKEFKCLNNNTCTI